MKSLKTHIQRKVQLCKTGIKVGSRVGEEEMGSQVKTK